MKGATARVVALLDELAALTELEEGSPRAFRVRALRRATDVLRELDVDVADLDVAALTALDGVGASTAARVREAVETGTIDRLEELRAAHPPGQLDLLAVDGLGPRTVAQLAVIGVVDVEGLRAAVADGRVAGLDGVGPATIATITAALRRGESGRTPLHVALPLGRRMAADLARVAGVAACEVVGAVRRAAPTLDEVELLVVTSGVVDVGGAVGALADVADVSPAGDGVTATTWDGAAVRVHTTQTSGLGAALVATTGDPAHLRALRARAAELGLADPLAAELATEAEVYARLGAQPVPPELRHAPRWLAAAVAGELPQLVRVDDLTGDLHDHTDLSGDGRQRLSELVAAAAGRGLAFLAVTDHAEDLRINGAGRAAMLAQRTALRRLGTARGDLRLYHGAELNIDRHGDLDYDAGFRADFDLCVASVHSHFRLSTDEQTARVVRAVADPAVRVLGHPTGRRLGRREGIDLDAAAVVDACVDHGVAIELNGNLERLDAPEELARVGVERGALFAVSSDAHSVAELDNASHGAMWARRCGVPRDRVVTTWDPERFERWVRDR